jgi:hypothetical protein
MNVLPPATATAASVRMSFAASESDLFPILLRGGLLQLPTFGFYRFWLKTEVRRHLWAHTLIGDEQFEYTGSGRELLIGFLVATVILIPIYVIYFLLALEAERQMAFASLPLILVLYPLLYYALFRGRRYRAARTVFRGIRFRMTGSGWMYFARAVPWDILTVITLGFAYPWRTAALERYVMRHTHYGDLAGEFAGKGWPLFKRMGWVWATYLALFVGLVFSVDQQNQWPARILGVLLGIATPLLFPTFRGIRLLWWLNGLRVGGVHTVSDLRTWSVVWCYVRATAWWFATAFAATVPIGFVVLFGRNAMVAISGSPHDVSEIVRIPTAIVGVVAIAAIYLAWLVAADLIERLFVSRGVWVAAIQSVTLTNIETLEAVVTSPDKLAGSVGEGLLDSFDIGPGF